MNNEKLNNLKEWLQNNLKECDIPNNTYYNGKFQAYEETLDKINELIDISNNSQKNTDITDNLVATNFFDHRMENNMKSNTEKCNIPTLKFRAYDIESKTMLYDTIAGYAEDGSIFMGQIGYFKGFLMLYTNQQDKNKLDIYAGDILKGNHKDLWVVIPLLGGLSIVNIREYGKPYKELIASPINDIQTSSWIAESIVVGNIHQNPELIIR